MGGRVNGVKCAEKLSKSNERFIENYVKTAM